MYTQIIGAVSTGFTLFGSILTLFNDVSAIYTEDNFSKTHFQMNYLEVLYGLGGPT